MKTTSITVERNFHILNDDRFIMEKISHTIELDDSDDAACAMNAARAEIEENFKLAYPNVETHLNFYGEKQIKENKVFSTNGLGHTTIEDMSKYKFSSGTDANGAWADIQPKKEYTPVASTQDIIKEMKAYTAGANPFKRVYELQVKGNPELEEVFNKKLKELENK